MEPISHKRKLPFEISMQEKRYRMDSPLEIWDRILFHLDIVSACQAAPTCKTWHELLSRQQLQAEKQLAQKIHDLIKDLLSQRLSDECKDHRCKNLASFIKPLQHKIGRLKLDPEPIIRIGSSVSFRLAPLSMIKKLAETLFSNLPYVHELDLRRWNWILENPASLSNLFSLRRLILPARCWVKPYWKELQKVIHLREIVIYKGGKETLNGIHHMTEMTRLDLIECTLTNKVMEKMPRLTSLECLNLVETAIICESKDDDSGMAKLSELTNLKILNLSKTTMSHECLLKFLSLTKLQSLTLKHANQKPLSLKDFSRLEQLKKLKLEGICLPDKIDIKQLSHLKKLKKLSIRLSWWQGGEFENLMFVSQFPYLEKLKLKRDTLFPEKAISQLNDEEFHDWLFHSNTLKYWKGYINMAHHPSLKEITLYGFPANMSPRGFQKILKQVHRRVYALMPL